jgi:superkiller protein 3
LLDPSQALHHNGLGRALHGQKKYLAALAEYLQAIKLDPGHPAFHYNSGLIFFAQNKYADAEAAYRQAIQLSPDDPGYRYVLGDALYEQWKFAEAEAEYRQAVKLELLGEDFQAEPGKFTEVPWGMHCALRKKLTELKQMLGKKL